MEPNDIIQACWHARGNRQPRLHSITQRFWLSSGHLDHGRAASTQGNTGPFLDSWLIIALLHTAICKLSSVLQVPRNHVHQLPT